MLPNAFKDRMKILLGNSYDEFISSFSDSLVKSIRVNTEKITVEDFLKISTFNLEKIPYTSDGFYVNEVSLGNHPYHHAGLFYVQDPAAMMPANLIELEPNMIVLDLCAAPGGKSGQIGAKLKNGILVANEINPNRAKILFSNIERMGLKNTIVLNNDSYALAKKYPSTFDVIFIDAPCSGEGMFRKDPNSIKEWSLKKIEECVKIQKELLKNADMMLKAGGIIVYSTCTYSLDEDELQITDFLKNFDYEVLEIDSIKKYTSPGYVNDKINPKLKKSIRFYPHITKGEGQFACVLKKKGNLVKTKLDSKTNDFLDKYIKCDVDIKLNSEIYDNRCYTKLPFDIKGMKIISSGVKLGEIKNDRFIYHHNFVTAYGNYFKNKLNLSLNDPRLNKYLHGYEIVDDSVKNGYGVILIDGYPLGLFKATNGILKNHYPSGLRMVK